MNTTGCWNLYQTAVICHTVLSSVGHLQKSFHLLAYIDTVLRLATIPTHAIAFLPVSLHFMICCHIHTLIQSSHYPAVPSEDSPTNQQCTMVRNKSYLTQGSAYPTSPNCPSRTNRHSSHSTVISPKSTDGTNPRSAKQQAIAKKMDT